MVPFSELLSLLRGTCGSAGGGIFFVEVFFSGTGISGKLSMERAWVPVFVGVEMTGTSTLLNVDWASAKSIVSFGEAIGSGSSTISSQDSGTGVSTMVPSCSSSLDEGVLTVFGEVGFNSLYLLFRFSSSVGESTRVLFTPCDWVSMPSESTATTSGESRVSWRGSGVRE